MSSSVDEADSRCSSAVATPVAPAPASGDDDKDDSSASSTFDDVLSYTSDMLRAMAAHPDCLRWPDCLSQEFKNQRGRWDPDHWHQFHLKVGKKEAAGTEGRENNEPTANKMKDPKSRLKAETDSDLVLSPQRRSFLGGCQIQPAPAEEAAGETSSSKGPLHGLAIKSAAVAATGGGRAQRVGSGRILNRGGEAEFGGTGAGERTGGKSSEFDRFASTYVNYVKGVKPERIEDNKRLRALGGSGRGNNPLPRDRLIRNNEPLSRFGGGRDEQPDSRRRRRRSQPEWMYEDVAQDEMLELGGFEDDPKSARRQGRAVDDKRNEATPHKTTFKEGKSGNSAGHQPEHGDEKRRAAGRDAEEAKKSRDDFDYDAFFGLGPMSLLSLNDPLKPEMGSSEPHASNNDVASRNAANPVSQAGPGGSRFSQFFQRKEVSKMSSHNPNQQQILSSIESQQPKSSSVDLTTEKEEEELPHQQQQQQRVNQYPEEATRFYFTPISPAATTEDQRNMSGPIEGEMPKKGTAGLSKPKVISHNNAASGTESRARAMPTSDQEDGLNSFEQFAALWSKNSSENAPSNSLQGMHPDAPPAASSNSLQNAHHNVPPKLISGTNEVAEGNRPLWNQAPPTASMYPPRGHPSSSMRPPVPPPHEMPDLLQLIHRHPASPNVLQLPEANWVKSALREGRMTPYQLLHLFANSSEGLDSLEKDIIVNLLKMLQSQRTLPTKVSPEIQDYISSPAPADPFPKQRPSMPRTAQSLHTVPPTSNLLGQRPPMPIKNELPFPSAMGIMPSQPMQNLPPDPAIILGQPLNGGGGGPNGAAASGVPTPLNSAILESTIPVSILSGMPARPQIAVKEAAGAEIGRGGSPMTFLHMNEDTEEKKGGSASASGTPSSSRSTNLSFTPTVVMKKLAAERRDSDPRIQLPPPPSNTGPPQSQQVHPQQVQPQVHPQVHPQLCAFTTNNSFNGRQMKMPAALAGSGGNLFSEGDLSRFFSADLLAQATAGRAPNMPPIPNQVLTLDDIEQH